MNNTKVIINRRTKSKERLIRITHAPSGVAVHVLSQHGVGLVPVH